MMIKNLSKVGNSSAILLDKALMELIGLDENGSVQLTVHDGSLILTPVNPHSVDPEHFQACLDKVVQKHGPVLRKLAE